VPNRCLLIVQKFQTKSFIIFQLFLYSFFADISPVLDKYEEFLPSEDDVYGAKMALLRLQDTFALSAKQISTGIVSDSKDHAKLSKC